MIKPFPKPVPPLNPLTSPAQIRGALNQLAKNISGTATSNVSTSATAIYQGLTGNAIAAVSGDSGAGDYFVDQVAWNGTANVVQVVSTTDITGAPAARTYTVVSGALTLAMAAGTYDVVCVPVVFTDVI